MGWVVLGLVGFFGGLALAGTVVSALGPMNNVQTVLVFVGVFIAVAGPVLWFANRMIERSERR